MKKIARSGAEGNTRLLAKYGGGSKPPRQSYPKGYATGGMVKDESPALNEGMEAADGEAARPNPGRAGRKASSKTNIVINVAPADKGAAGLPPPMPMPPASPAMPPPAPPMAGPPPGPGMMPPGGPPIGPRPFKTGGRVGKDKMPFMKKGKGSKSDC